MRNTPRAVRRSLFGLILVVAALSVPPAFPPRAGANLAHAPIIIAGNGDFTAANGVVGGTGSASDPYVIEGWEINVSAAPAGVGIAIRDTDASFVIRGVRVQDESSMLGIGAEFRNVTNGRVEDSRFVALLEGLVLNSSSVQLHGNNVSGWYQAVSLEASRNVTMDGNVAAGGEHAVFVEGSENVTIAGNELEGGLWTVVLGASTGVRVLHNNIRYEALHAAMDYDANAWDDGYPSGGNHWYGHQGVDLCSGPNQDVCPDPDGIDDAPFNITGGQDSYPLMDPYPVPPLDRPPGAPVLEAAALTGADLENVTLSWSLSADDGGGGNDVVSYEIWAGGVYDPTGSTYVRVAVLPPGTTSYVDAGAGAGHPADRYYQVVVHDRAGYSTTAVDQAGKWSQSLVAGRHLLSVPLEPSDWRVATVLQTIPWTRVWHYPNAGGPAWLSNAREKSFAGLTMLNRTMGFWVDTSADARWTIAGLVPRSTQVVLRTGWNMVGYPKLVPCPLSAILGGVGYETVETFADAPPYYLRTMGPSETLRAGNGYWVLMAGAASFTVTN